MSIGPMIWLILAVVSGVSLLVGRPWTATISRGRYTDQVQAHPLFHEANVVITAAWSAFFGVAAIATSVTSTAAIIVVGSVPIAGWLSFRAGERYAPWRLRRSNSTGQAVTNLRQAELRALIVDKNDDEILAWTQGVPGGIPQVLDETVAGMADVLDPSAAEDCVVGYEIASVVGDFSYRVEVRGQDVLFERCEPTDARVVLRLNLADYLRLIAGLLDGVEAFVTGRMQINGDLAFAPQVAQMFPTPA